MLPLFVLLIAVCGGLGFIFLRWPTAGAKMMQAFRDNSRWHLSWPINVWTARLFGAQLVLGALFATLVLILWLVKGDGIAAS
jgi:hypothetical protein